VNWQAVSAGAATDVAIAALGAAVSIPQAVRWPAFAALAGAGLLGGYVAGRLASGPPPQFAARYDAAIGVAVALAFGGLYVAEGAAASVTAPGGEPDPATLGE